ncbi:hypothetical protein LGK95_09890 [Clostridium algoriphilum]|uniref:tetratricopeptide repeat protein n=1 Tax=Clostridium algoriphilum TaxID=198347 RepID=UPI001CF4456C|nr:hypothetical protein [Clostridium algoriphilum]MCB2293831.1 hypothetical protein [Clostridium algoriphilum]
MKNSINLMSDETLVKEYIERGKGLFNDGEIEKAFKDFNKAIFLNNFYAEAYFVKAQAHIEIYEAFEAEECIKKYLKLVPDDPKGYWKLIEINDLTGDFDTCIYYCEKLLEWDNKNATTYFKKAEFLAILNDFNKALECFDICLTLSPYFYDALCGKARVLFSLHNRKEAIDIYSKAIGVDNSKSIAYFGMSEVHMSLGNNIIALEFAEKAYKIEPTNEWYKCHYSILKDINTSIK